MKYFTAEGTYIWQLDSEKPLADPVCVFDGIDEELATSIADALMRAYLDGFEEGVWKAAAQ